MAKRTTSARDLPDSISGAPTKKRESRASRSGTWRRAVGLALAVSCAAQALAAFAEAAPSATAQSPALSPVHSPSQSIEGGSDAAVGDYPSVAALLDRRLGSSDLARHYCGGTLVRPEWVLTAAHCLFDDDGSPRLAADLIVGIGGAILNDLAASQARATTRPGGGAQFYGVADIRIHPSYAPSTRDSDIALLRLRAAASTGTAGAAPQIADVSTTRAVGGVRAHIAGWGRMRNGRKSITLQASDRLETIGPSECQQLLADASDSQTLTDRMLCAHNAAREVDPCQGDSGGPLYTSDGGGGLSLVGIISSGSGCPMLFGFASVPGIYTRLSEFVGWISQTAVDPDPDPDPNPTPDPTPDATPDSDAAPDSDGGSSGGGCSARATRSAAIPLPWLLVLASTLIAARRLSRPNARPA